MEKIIMIEKNLNHTLFIIVLTLELACYFINNSKIFYYFASEHILDFFFFKNLN
jgi:hypothetical protein